MCGITAYAGTSPALPFLMQGLKKLEYRGYDSAGVTLAGTDGLVTIKAKGRLAILEEKLAENVWNQTTGIGHTRWATHGIPSNLNSHPHMNEEGTIAIVHNGIIENYAPIREFLQEQGCHFQSDTDSEVIVHMLDYYYEGDMLGALVKTVRYLQGSFALCVVCADEPDTVYTVRKESPMVLGMCEGASFCASDIPAILEYTKEIVPMEDGQIARLRPDGIQLYDFEGNETELVWQQITYDVQAAQKGGYDTYMQKEMHEQPYVISETLRGRILSDRILFPELDDANLENVDRIYLIACGTAYHAGCYGAYLLRQWLPRVFSACIPASEYRYGNYPANERTLCIFISQSGETADTLAALKDARTKGALCVAVANVLGSSLCRQADLSLYTCAGPEIAVASTKAYTTQLVLLAALMLYLADRMQGLVHDRERFVQDLAHMPACCEKMLELEDEMAACAASLKDKQDAYFIGRQLDHVSVLEGALKLKEVSYIHADAYYAGELKHGPIALIDEGTFVLALATQPDVASKTISNIQETAARGARVTLITGAGMDVKGFERVIQICDMHPYLAPVPVTILLQELAYHAAVVKGCDMDKPRNLAKSVTVE